MRLSDHQAAFTLDLARIILWVHTNRPQYRMRLREVTRTPEMQQVYIDRGESWTYNSQHLKHLAADFVLDKNGVYLTESADYKFIGEAWERLSPYNRWGGRFGDGNHLERREILREEPTLEA
jgi:hypothetical protein